MKEVRISLFQFLEQARRPPRPHSVEERIRHFAKIYHDFSQEQALEQGTRCIDCGNPYCQWQCPLHNRIPKWLQLLAEDRIMEAATLVHSTNSLPEMCGQLCPQESLCEGACTLHGPIGAVTIGALENYITDTALKRGWKPELSHVRELPYKVAIIGAGPAGLACADRLRRLGIFAEVYDAHPEIGGLLTFGIPQFKLEKHIVQRRRALLESIGICFHTNTTIGKDLTLEQLLAQNDAIFLGIGADKGLQAGIPGETLPHIYQALPFLIRNIHNTLGLSQSPINLTGQRVAILGAGDTAMDCARSCIRLGAKEVHCLYRRHERDLNNSQKDYRYACEEGVQFHWNAQVTAFHGKEQLEALQINPTSVRSDGRVEVLKNGQRMPIEHAIVAYGFQGHNHHWLRKQAIDYHPRNLIDVSHGALPLQTTHAKIFAGGDCVLGANLVVNAVNHGQKAAHSIFNYLHEGRL